jgi:hypothetical protein
MAFPTIDTTFGTGSTFGSTATASPVVNLPATVTAGMTLIVLHRCAVGGAIGWPDASWNEMFDASADGSDDQMAMAWKKADGTEGGTTITLSQTSGKFASLAVAIDAAEDPTIQPPELSTVATGASATPDPTTCTPTGGAKDYLWFWVGGWEGEQTVPPPTPTNYSALQRLSADSGTGGAITTNVRVVLFWRTNNAASEDPASITISASDDWTAYTMAVHPVGAAAERVPFYQPYTQLLAH